MPTQPNAPSPYDDPVHADIILQSSDNVNFFVYKLLLSLVSPVFKDMFTLPQPAKSPSDATNGRDGGKNEETTVHPVIPVAEDSDTLHRLLTWCDPRGSPATGTLEEIQVVLRVADKYDMQAVANRVGEMLAYGLAGLCPSGSGAVRIYAIAVRYSLAALAQKAAKLSLRAKWEDLMNEDVPELEHIPGSALHRLQQYRIACGAVAKKVAMDWTWVPDATGLVSECQVCASGAPPRHWSKWWAQYMSVAAEELYRNPSGATISPELAIIPLAHLGSCSDCGRTQGETYRALVRFNPTFIKEIDRAVGEVPGVTLH
ncbi:hypothetical protein B0H17DRAFT_1198334 [Mycena rosella]|uniref:BTB domain-containing protein n=1 Tax=Mycena rosella TaxID=1033263 RepID=A0AAD7GL40_MYCRO|nr:hypothetical protein B0H17DRAFT_1198334 [Mycena rosella]